MKNLTIPIMMIKMDIMNLIRKMQQLCFSKIILFEYNFSGVLVVKTSSTMKILSMTASFYERFTNITMIIWIIIFYYRQEPQYFTVTILIFFRYYSCLYLLPYCLLTFLLFLCLFILYCLICWINAPMLLNFIYNYLFYYFYYYFNHFNIKLNRTHV